MKLTNSGGTYYSNLKRLTRLRPKYKPDGDRGIRRHHTGLIWSEATMTWDELYSTWEEIA